MFGDDMIFCERQRIAKTPRFLVQKPTAKSQQPKANSQKP